MKYHAYELGHAFVSPMRMAAHAMKLQVESPFNPLSMTPFGKQMAAAFELFENATRRYGKPEWGIEETKIHGLTVPIEQRTVLAKPFCNLVRFKRDEAVAGRRDDPKVLVVAPMSGHYATLLRGTVEAMLPEHDVYVTDWVDAREIPVGAGSFGLGDFVDHIIEFSEFMGENTHILAVCQPAVPVLAACAVMAARDEPFQPSSMTLMGGPIDTRRNPTAVNDLAESKPLSWFEQNVISTVPFPNPGFMRPVYPGFVQLTGFMTMNLERHTQAHVDLFNNLVQGDCDSVAQHNKFYDEYLAVMDLPAKFYLETIDKVFKSHALPEGKLMHHGKLVDCSKIKRTALLTVEGENDDICGLGQTEAAHSLCKNIPVDERYHYVQEGVGHYGVFNGTRWRTEIQPRIREFIRAVDFKRMTQPAEGAVTGASATKGKKKGKGKKKRGLKIGLPYRALQDEREDAIVWDCEGDNCDTTDHNGQTDVNGTNGSSETPRGTKH